MKLRLLSLLLVLLPGLALAQTTNFPTPPLNGFQQYVPGQMCMSLNGSNYAVPCSSSNPLPVTVTGGGGSTVNQGNAGSAAQAWFSQQVLGGTVVSNTNPMPVTVISGRGTQAIAYAAPGSTVSVTTASTSVLGAAAYTHTLTLCTEPADAGNVWLNLSGGAAVVNTGFYVPSAGGCVTIAPPTAAITGISDSGTSHLTVQGG